MAAAAFFAKLPAKRLTPLEVELRDLLRKAAGVAARLLPQDAVTLQEWAERRIPEEVLLATNHAGMVVLMLPDDGAPAVAGDTGDAAAAMALPPARRGTYATPAAPAHAANAGAEAFFRRLPADAFLPQEESLRDAVCSALAGGPLPASQVSTEPAVNFALKAVLPHTVPLTEWIERRVGAEIIVYHNEAGQPMCRLAVSTHKDKKDARREGFFASLPPGAFSQREEALRAALFDFLARWATKGQGPPNLSHAGGDPVVKTAKTALLPEGIALREWIERRIGAEIELMQDSTGQHVLCPVAQVPHAELGAGREVVKQATRQAFFSGLPVGELLPVEHGLREALLQFLEEWRGRPGSPVPVLADAGQHEGVQRHKQALLPKEVSLKEWIEQRLSHDIVLGPAPNGQVRISQRGAARGVLRTTPATGVNTVSGVGTDAAAADRAEEREAARQLVAAEREAFFDSLPPDGFTPEEERLREALLTFLHAWQGPGPATMSDAGGDPEVRAARAVLLPRGRGGGVSLREWIDRRIGGEVDTMQLDPASPIIAIGLTGSLNHAALAQVKLPKKRKAAGPPVEGMGAKQQRLAAASPVQDMV